MPNHPVLHPALLPALQIWTGAGGTAFGDAGNWGSPAGLFKIVR